MNKRPPLVDGWHDLPGGGSVEIKNGIPIQITDQGHHSIEETKLLAMASEFTDTKLSWWDDCRSKRWREDGLVKVLLDTFKHAPMRYTWSYAKVCRGTCLNGTDDVGVCWIDRRTGREWVCKSCAEEILELDAAEEAQSDVEEL